MLGAAESARGPSRPKKMARPNTCHTSASRELLGSWSCSEHAHLTVRCSGHMGANNSSSKPPLSLVELQCSRVCLMGVGTVTVTVNVPGKSRGQRWGADYHRRCQALRLPTLLSVDLVEPGGAFKCPAPRGGWVRLHKHGLRGVGTVNGQGQPCAR